MRLAASQSTQIVVWGFDGGGADEAESVELIQSMNRDSKVYIVNTHSKSFFHRQCEASGLQCVFLDSQSKSLASDFLDAFNQ